MNVMSVIGNCADRKSYNLPNPSFGSSLQSSQKRKFHRSRNLTNAGPGEFRRMMCPDSEILSTSPVNCFVENYMVQHEFCKAMKTGLRHNSYVVVTYSNRHFSAIFTRCIDDWPIKTKIV